MWKWQRLLTGGGGKKAFYFIIEILILLSYSESKSSYIFARQSSQY